MANDDILNRLREDAAMAGVQPGGPGMPGGEPEPGGGEQFGMPMGEGEGKLSEEEIEAARALVDSLPEESIKAMAMLPEEQFAALLAEELEKNEVDGVDIPDIIEVVQVLLKEKAGAGPADSAEGEAGIPEE
jgi:hypothetical protein